MNNNLIATNSIEINAKLEHIWDTITNPEKIKSYLFGTNVITNWEVGSEIIFKGEYNGQTYVDKGFVLKYDPFKLIEYSYWSAFSGLEDKPENYSTVSYKLEPQSSELVKFTWHQKGFSSEEGKCHTEDGLKPILLTIKNLSED